MFIIFNKLMGKLKCCKVFIINVLEITIYSLFECSNLFEAERNSVCATFKGVGAYCNTRKGYYH